MSLLGNIVGSLTGSGQPQGQLLQIIADLIGKHGGVEGVVQKFASSGLGDQARQWVSQGANPPITGEHVQQVFGDETVQQVAGQLGVHPTQAASGLAALLAAVIDKLTPNGQSVSGADLQQNVAALLQGGTSGLGLGDLTRLFGK